MKKQLLFALLGVLVVSTSQVYAYYIAGINHSNQSIEIEMVNTGLGGNPKATAEPNGGSFRVDNPMPLNCHSGFRVKYLTGPNKNRVTEFKSFKGSCDNWKNVEIPDNPATGKLVIETNQFS